MPSSVRRKNARDVVAAALAAGRTFEEAAATGGVNKRTARRWYDEDEQFREQVKTLQAEVVGRTLSILSTGMAGAATELLELVKHCDPHVRFKAAKTVIDLGLKVREFEELKRQVEEMAQQITELSK
jgi:hypothetical protein